MNGLLGILHCGGEKKGTKAALRNREQRKGDERNGREKEWDEKVNGTETGMEDSRIKLGGSGFFPSLKTNRTGNFFLIIKIIPA